MVQFVVEEEEDRTIPEDTILRAKLIEVSPKTISWKDRQTNEDKTADIYEWWFEIVPADGVNEAYIGRRVKGSTAAKLTIRSVGAKWFEAIMGRPLPVGVKSNSDDLIGMQADILIGHRRNKDRIYEEVTEVINPNSDPWAVDGGNQDTPSF